MVALFAVLALSSCVKEELGHNGDEATMTLSINLPDGVATKAYGDGKFADKNLIIGVFDENGVEKFRKNYVWGPEVFSDEVTIRFVMGKSYQLVLWAQYGDAYGDPTSMPLDKITLDYKASNREDLDAFYCYVPTFKVTKDFEKSITLKRPFAQLNFATTVGDIEESIAAGDLGIHNKAEVTVKNVANTLDLFTGKTSYVAADGKVLTEGAEVVIPATEFPSVKGAYQQIKVEDVNYEILAMNYILVADEGAQDGKTTVDLKLQVGELVINVPGANMKRNWRTNVVGELLTAEGTFKVVIDPEFGGEYNENWNDGTGSENENEKPEEPDTPVDPEEPAVEAWGIVGTFNEWSGDLEMTEVKIGETTYWFADDFKVAAEDGFKFRFTDGNWDDANVFGAATTVNVNAATQLLHPGNDIKVAAGTYDIYLDVANELVYVMANGKTPADVVAPEKVNVEVYVVKADWSNNNLYAWGALTAGSWPGKVADETVTINSVEYYKWTLSVAASAIGQDAQVIFNNAQGAQTVDSPAFKLAQKQYFKTGAAVDGKYAVEQIAEPVVEEPEPETPVEPEEPEEPAGPKVVTVAEFLAAENDETIEYQISGTISGIYQAYNATYNNISIYITDATGEMLAYRLSCEGITDPAATITKGDEITVKGKRTLYNEAPQMAAGCVIVKHTDVVVEEPELPANAKVLSFADKANRTTYEATSKQVWEQNGITVINDKAASTTNIGDYAAPARFYKSSKLTIQCEGMTKIVFDCPTSESNKYLKPLADVITGSTVDGGLVTVEFTEAVDELVLDLTAGQVRVNSITVYTK